MSYSRTKWICLCAPARESSSHAKAFGGDDNNRSHSASRSDSARHVRKHRPAVGAPENAFRSRSVSATAVSSSGLPTLRQLDGFGVGNDADTNVKGDAHDVHLFVVCFRLLQEAALIRPELQLMVNHAPNIEHGVHVESRIAYAWLGGMT
jgi:hypothetical protein